MFVALGLPFPQVHLSVGGGGGGGQQASSLSSTHKLWNFHRYSLVLYKYVKFDLNAQEVAGSIPALELFFHSFFSVSFFPLSFSFMLALPFQCSSIFLV